MQLIKDAYTHRRKFYAAKSNYISMKIKCNKWSQK